MKHFVYAILNIVEERSIIKLKGQALDFWWTLYFIASDKAKEVPYQFGGSMYLFMKKKNKKTTALLNVTSQHLDKLHSAKWMKS